MWLGDAAYTDHLKGAFGKADYSMPAEYVKERFQMTLDDQGKFPFTTFLLLIIFLVVNMSTL